MPKNLTHLTDSHGRSVRYLRISVTDRCNLRCVYCVNHQPQQFIPHANILRYEQILRMVRICRQQGIRKVRITGGEPFARLGLVPFLRAFRSQLPDLQLCITTNATLLDPYIPDLPSLGLTSFNISLDTFDSETYTAITGKNSFATTINAIESLLSRNQPVKINAVAMRGITDTQMADFIHAINQYPIDLRFIEFMPMGSNTLWNQEKFISTRELFTIAASHATLAEADSDSTGLSGPARMFNVQGAKGRLGFISAISDHFCKHCNRLRLTSSGGLRTCLFSDKEFNLAGLLRHPAITDARIAHIVRQAMHNKPLGSELLAARSARAVAHKQMVGIGG